MIEKIIENVMQESSFNIEPSTRAVTGLFFMPKERKGVHMVHRNRLTETEKGGSL